MYEPRPSSFWYLILQHKLPCHLQVALAVDSRGAPTFLPRSQALPASSYAVHALSACLVGPWSLHTQRGLELLPSPGSSVSTSGPRLKDSRSISRHTGKARCARFQRLGCQDPLSLPTCLTQPCLSGPRANTWRVHPPRPDPRTFLLPLHFRILCPFPCRASRSLWNGLRGLEGRVSVRPALSCLSAGLDSAQWFSRQQAWAAMLVADPCSSVRSVHCKRIPVMNVLLSDPLYSL